MEWIAIIVALVALYLFRDLDQRLRKIEAGLHAGKRVPPDLPAGPASPEEAAQPGDVAGPPPIEGAAGVVAPAPPVVPPPPPPLRRTAVDPTAPAIRGAGVRATRVGPGDRGSRSSGPAAPSPGSSSAAAPSPGSPAKQDRVDFESFLGGRVLLVTGVVVILLGLGFFLHHAIKTGLLGPGLRTILTALGGGLALVGGEVLRRRALDVFAAALSGAGIGALFLATHFAANVHHFVSRPTGFLLAAAITAGGVVLGVMRRSPFLTHLGFLGGWLAPALFGTPTESVWPLARWLLLVDVGVLAIRSRLPYAGLDLMAAIAAAIYLGGFVLPLGGATPLSPTVAAWVALSLSRVVLAVAPPWISRSPPPWKALAAAVIGAIATVLIGAELLIEEHRLGLGLAILPFAAIYFAAALASRRRLVDSERAARGYGAIAITLLAAAIPMIFPEVARAPVYAVAAVAFFVIGSASNRVVPRLGGYAYLALAVSNAFEHRWPMHEEAFRLFWNDAFVTHLFPALAILASGRVLARAGSGAEGRALSVIGTVAIAGLGAWEVGRFVELGGHAFLGLERRAEFAAAGWFLVVAGWVVQRAWARVEASLAPIGPALCALGALVALPAVEKGARFGDGVVLNPGFLVGLGAAIGLFACAWSARGAVRGAVSVGFALWVLVVLTLDVRSLGRSGALLDMPRADLRFLSLVLVSVVWAANGAVWTWLGFLWRQQSARFAGIGLLAITVAKVFLVDLSDLDKAWRAGSFLGLGALLLAVSYLYHRRGREERDRDAETGA